MMNKELEIARSIWLDKHKQEASPERLKRLEGNLYLEAEFLDKIWWPASEHWTTSTPNMR